MVENVGEADVTVIVEMQEMLKMLRKIWKKSSDRPSGRKHKWVVVNFQYS